MAKAPDNERFTRVVQPHFDRLYGLAWRLSGQQASAEDLFQELMIKACLKLDELEQLDEPGAWLARVMYNLFVDEHRRFARQRLLLVGEGRLPGDGLAGFAGEDDPVRNAERDEETAELERALEKLGEEHRIVLLLHDADGYKLKEIQELMGVPIGTVKSRLHRARARFQEILVQRGTIPATQPCKR
ncbi:MAG TPA: RNA polymerase sigma factor [Woeseiaceae bacterium]|nr:RNA polymerase sigma factor [Woeseiaceae bacterium]